MPSRDAWLGTALLVSVALPAEGASPSPDSAASPSPVLASSAVTANGWTASVLPAPDARFVTVVGVAVGPEAMVAVGNAVCGPPRRDESARCWGHAASGDRTVVGTPICWDCPPAMLISDDLSTWRVGYGSPVDGRLAAMTSAAGRFHAVLIVPGATDGDRTTFTLAVWSSDDGTQWKLEEEQPVLPVPVTSFHAVDMAVAGDRLVVSAAGETDDTSGFASVALLGPVLR